MDSHTTAMTGFMQSTLKKQYARTMREAYAYARSSAASHPGSCVLDCGSGSGHELLATFGTRQSEPGFRYLGLEWNKQAVDRGADAGLDIRLTDLNAPLPIDPDSHDCVIAYSVIEHLLMPCSFLLECQRVLKPGGRLVLLTPNISTYFTALQILLGRMPSSGPHPDSNRLLELEQPTKVTHLQRDDVSSDTPVHRHLVVFSFRALYRFLQISGYSIIAAKGFGYYPIPMAMQPLFERIDRGHCHQMVLVCEKP